MTPETRRRLLSSILVLALAAVFFAFFQLPKQVPALSSAKASAVISVQVGLESAGLLIGYALLRGPLGLERRWRMLATADDTRDEG